VSVAVAPITMYGAGAIGGIVGAHMAQAGEDLLFVDKVAEHVAAMNARGLRITGSKELTVPARARSSACTTSRSFMGRSTNCFNSASAARSAAASAGFGRTARAPRRNPLSS